MTPATNDRSVIPMPAWIVAAVVFGFLFVLLIQIGPHKLTPNARMILPVLVPLAAAGNVLAIGYVYGDAKRRGMRYVMWTLLATFLFWGVGIVLYFILREPLAGFCSKCGKAANHNFAYCPHCGVCLQPSCPACHRVIEGPWSHCAWCGTPVTTRGVAPSMDRPV
jgi:hypothetical protein